MDVQRSGSFIKTHNNGFHMTLFITLVGHEVGEVGDRTLEP